MGGQMYIRRTLSAVDVLICYSLSDAALLPHLRLHAMHARGRRFIGGIDKQQ